ncbi:hypothetical protein NC652_025222 [Populus alba x Populus x berolinensis]|nr:hypothetical protein NC652_025222 [Populus alba x Populus x berolinensis]
MAINRKGHATVFFTILFTILLTLSTIQFGAAMRPVHGEQWLKNHFPRIESLQRGPVSPSAGSPCSHNPGGSGHCTMNEMNFVGRANHQPPPPFPSSAGPSLTLCLRPSLFVIKSVKLPDEGAKWDQRDCSLLGLRGQRKQ